jgi:YaiO family outer membrane protein
MGLMLMLVLIALYAQAQSWKQLNVDELFVKARKEAFEGNREEARAMLQEILDRSPEYFEVRIFLARTYAWDQQRDKAHEELTKVLAKAPTNEDTLSALCDVEMWDEQYNQALATANLGLQHHPNAEDFLYKKAVILSELNQKKEASATIDRLLEINPAHVKANQLKLNLNAAAMKYTAGVIYSADVFSRTFNPAHYLSAQLAREFSWGSAIVRMNYSNRFQSSGVQPEIDLYPRIANGVYAYLNYGYATSALFPNHRFGAEVYSKLPKSFEASAGMRYLNFGSGSTVAIYTGSIGWYVKDYWLSFRPYITPGNTGTSFSSSLSLRRYFQDGDNYIGFTSGFGFSPDDRKIQSSNGLSTDGIYLLRSQRFGLMWQKTFAHQVFLSINVNVSRQELSFDRGNYVWITSPQITLRKRF